MFKRLIALTIVLSSLLCSFGVTSLAKENEALAGDIDGDGQITSTDFLRIKSYLLDASLYKALPLSAADFNKDGEITATDYLNIKILWLSSNNVAKENTLSQEASVNSEYEEDEASEGSVSEEVIRKTITLYVPNEDYTYLKTYRSYYNGTVQGIISALIDMGVLTEGTEVLSFSITGNTASIDLSEEFGVALNNARTVENIFLASLANTIIDCYGVEYLEFTVEGEVFETGLIIYDFPIEFLEPITIYLPNESKTDLVPMNYYFNGTIDGLVSALANLGAIPKETKVYSFKIDGKTAVIDLSSEFGTSLNESRTAENVFLGALANTIIKYYEVDNLLFTVEGEVFETGLTVYDSPIEFTKKLILYVPTDDYSDVVPYNVYFNGTIDDIISLLINYNVLPEETKVNSFEIYKDEAIIDLSSEFGVALNEARTSEKILLASLANTIIKNYCVSKLVFTVEGGILETGLVIYDFPIEFTESVTIWVPNEDKAFLIPQKSYFNGTVDSLFSLLVSNDVFPKDTKVNAFNIKNGIASIDLSAEFGIAINEARTSAESLINSLVNTLAEKYDFTELYFTVEGETLETGLVIYDFSIKPVGSTILFVPDKEQKELETEEIRFTPTAQNLVYALISKGLLLEATTINSLETNETTVKVDFSEEFGTAINEARTSGAILMGAIANTFIRYYGVEYFSFTVNGEILETGLVVYDSPIEFMEFVTIYVPDENHTSLVSKTSYFNGSANDLIDLLIAAEVLPENTSLIYFDKSKDTVLVDLSEEFGIAINEGRTYGALLVRAVANTFIDHYNTKFFKFTVDGEVLETGLEIYNSPIEFMPIN